MIHVLYAKLAELLKEVSFKEHLHSLPISEKEKILRYKKKEDQQMRLLGRLLLRKAGEFLLDGEDVLQNIKYDAYHRPYIGQHNGNIDFNISHSGSYVVLASSLK